MPELPEVETIRQYLGEVLPGRRIEAVVHLDQRLVKMGAETGGGLVERLTGMGVGAIGRRGKFLWLENAAPGGGAFVIHLGMSGRLVLEPPARPRRPHTHLVLRVGPEELRLSDPRRFGRIGWLPDPRDLDRRLGVEPLGSSFTAAYLAAAWSGRRAPVKALLLDQRVVAGIGNIYADEALYRARIHPRTPAGLLSPPRLEALVRAVRKVLRDGVRHRGTSFSDYVDALGEPGHHLPYLSVYGKKDGRCRRCRRALVREVIQGRGSWFCPRCQVLAVHADARPSPTSAERVDEPRATV